MAPLNPDLYIYIYIYLHHRNNDDWRAAITDGIWADPPWRVLRFLTVRKIKLLE